MKSKWRDANNKNVSLGNFGTDIIFIRDVNLLSFWPYKFDHVNKFLKAHLI